MSGDDVMSAALAYAERGWYVFPVQGKQPMQVGVTPDGEPRRLSWSKESSNDPHQIAAWFSASSGLGIGLDLGKSGLVVVDGDHLGVLAETLPDDLLTGWTWHGNPDRRSWLFEVNGTPVPQAGHDWGEVKAGGGYVVLPPSPHQAEKCRACAEGDHCYVWENTDGDKPPTIADRLIPLLSQEAVPPKAATHAPQSAQGPGRGDRRREAARRPVAEDLVRKGG